jgi:hypothetical protein
MEIIRNGKKYKLTLGELRRASEEYDHLNRVEDVKSRLKAKCIYATDEDIDRIACDAEHNLSKSDDYCEAMWLSIEQTIDDYFEKR